MELVGQHEGAITVRVDGEPAEAPCHFWVGILEGPGGYWYVVGDIRIQFPGHTDPITNPNMAGPFNGGGEAWQQAQRLFQANKVEIDHIADKARGASPRTTVGQA